MIDFLETRPKKFENLSFFQKISIFEFKLIVWKCAPSGTRSESGVSSAKDGRWEKDPSEPLLSSFAGVERLIVESMRNDDKGTPRWLGYQSLWRRGRLKPTLDADERLGSWRAFPRVQLLLLKLSSITINIITLKRYETFQPSSLKNILSETLNSFPRFPARFPRLALRYF